MVVLVLVVVAGAVVVDVVVGPFAHGVLALSQSPEQLRGGGKEHRQFPRQSELSKTQAFPGPQPQVQYPQPLVVVLVVVG